VVPNQVSPISSEEVDQLEQILAQAMLVIEQDKETKVFQAEQIATL
jgi:hypothetical protein